MAGINNVVLVGRLTKDPELMKTKSGISFCRFTVAIDRPKKKDDQTDAADFPGVVAWRQQADFIGNYGAKGMMVSVEGAIQTGSYKDRDGRTVYTTEILANRIQLLESIESFYTEASKLEGISFLAQGTIYPDILESDGVKAHHNVGGLPEDMQMELVEPVALLYKDEVRVVGSALGLPDEMVYRQPFPGPGLGVRCLGAITRDRLHALREADAILREEFDKCGLAGEVWQYFIAVPDVKSVGVKDSKRYEGWPAIIRAVNTTDAMSATIEEIPYSILHKITDRITHEVDGINRVLYDLTPKPIGTIEWE